VNIFNNLKIISKNLTTFKTFSALQVKEEMDIKNCEADLYILKK